jgi:putative peptidoglycan lipid II flippase
MIRKKFQQTLAKFNGEVSGMHDAAYLLAGFALLSTLLALVRDKLLAHVFGAGVQLDIYYAAFRIPDLVFTVVASMVSVFVLIPFLSRHKSDDERQSFIHTLLLIFGGLLISISTLIALFAPQIVEMFFGELVMRGYGSELTGLVRILLIQPFVLGLSSIVSSVVQYYGRYFIYALAPLLYNIGIIIGIIFFAPRFGIIGLGYGVVLGSLLHLAIQLPSFYKLGFATHRALGTFKDALAVMLVSLPRTVALSANQVTLFILVAMAGTMSEGSIAIFTLAFNLQAAPVSIVGVSYSTAAFPTLSKLFARGASHEFTHQITAAARHIVFWSLPVIALVIVLRAQIVRVIYGSGAFDWTDTRLTAAALALFIISLTAQCIVLLFVRGYYAACKTVKPQVLTVLSAIMTVVFAILLEQTYASNEYWRNFLEAMMRTDGTGSTGVLMLPLAYTLSSCITALLFLVLFAYDFRGSTKVLRKTFWESLVGAFVIGLVAYITLGFFSDVVEIETLWSIFLQGAVAGLLGIAAGIITLIAIGNTEVRTVWQVLHHKVWKTKKVIAETDIT